MYIIKPQSTNVSFFIIIWLTLECIKSAEIYKNWSYARQGSNSKSTSCNWDRFQANVLNIYENVLSYKILIAHVL